MVINVHKPENENTIVVVAETSSKVGYIFPFQATRKGFSLNSSFKALIYLDFISFFSAMALPLRFRRRPHR